MKKNVTTYEELEKIAKDSLGGQIHPQGLGFVLAAFEFSLRRLRVRSRPQVVSCQELCNAVRDLAAQEYGLMAKEVLNAWGIESTETVGRIVFALVEAQKMTKTEEDTLADFNRVFNFDESFSPGAILKATRDLRSKARRPT